MAVDINLGTKPYPLELHKIFPRRDIAHLEMLAIPQDGIAQFVDTHLESLGLVPCPGQGDPLPIVVIIVYGLCPTNISETHQPIAVEVEFLSLRSHRRAQCQCREHQ